MLKKSGALLLTMLYVIAVIGFALNLNYCGKIITDVKIDAPSHSCDKSPMAAKMKCCTQKHIDIKIKDAHEGGSISIFAKGFDFQLPVLSFAQFSFIGRPILFQKAFYASPPKPGPCGVAVFVKNCAFLV